MKSLSSDQLRKRLHKNTLKMGRLTEKQESISRKLESLTQLNDAIVFLLKGRGLQAISYLADSGEDLTNAINGEPALNLEDLKSEDWWCADVSAECANAFAIMGLHVFAQHEWGLQRGFRFRFESAIFSSERNYVTRSLKSSFENKRQIHRVGQNFYWCSP